MSLLGCMFGCGRESILKVLEIMVLCCICYENEFFFFFPLDFQMILFITVSVCCLVERNFDYFRSKNSYL